MVCSSPACPPHAILTDVIERINASCVPSAIASGTSPMSQFRSIFGSPRFIPKSTPLTREVLPVLLTILAPLPTQLVQIESHRAAEAAPDYGSPRNSHWQSSHTRTCFAAQQKVLLANIRHRCGRH